MPDYRLARAEILRLIRPGDGAAHVSAAFEAQIEAAYDKDRFVCDELARLDDLAKRINAECCRLASGGKKLFTSKYSPLTKIPAWRLMHRAIKGQSVPLRQLVRIDDAISVICAKGEDSLKEVMRKYFKEGALPDRSIKFLP